MDFSRTRIFHAKNVKSDQMGQAVDAFLEIIPNGFGFRVVVKHISQYDHRSIVVSDIFMDALMVQALESSITDGMEEV